MKIKNFGKDEYTIVYFKEEGWCNIHLYNDYQNSNNIVVGETVIYNAYITINDGYNVLIINGNEKITNNVFNPIQIVINGNYMIYYHDKD